MGVIQRATKKDKNQHARPKDERDYVTLQGRKDRVTPDAYDLLEKRFTNTY